MWNIAAVSDDDHGSYRTTLIVKLVVVAASGLTAWLHARATTKAGLAAFGALTALTALGALFLGILLAGEDDPAKVGPQPQVLRPLPPARGPRKLGS
jgi:hypothetical protein